MEVYDSDSVSPKWLIVQRIWTVKIASKPKTGAGLRAIFANILYFAIATLTQALTSARHDRSFA
jgi:hypothetical protein